MLSDHDFYVVVKLISGEQMMAVLIDEDDDFIIVDHPMCIRMIPVLAENKEHLTAYPLCHFAEDTSFVLDKKNCIYVKKMHHVFVKHYQRIVNEYDETTLVTRHADGSVKSAEDLNWEDEELYTVEDSEDERIFVEGNDTIN
jgi:hypothetical protein